jgi:hypothetical protein
MRGGGLATRTTSVNLASRRAASPGEGEGDSSSDSVVVPAKGAEGPPGTGDAGGSAMHWEAIVGPPMKLELPVRPPEKAGTPPKAPQRTLAPPARETREATPPCTEESST